MKKSGTSGSPKDGRYSKKDNRATKEEGSLSEFVPRRQVIWSS